MAMVSQNKKKLRKILSQRTITAEWFEKFILYTNNIIKYWKVLMDYKEKESMKTFDRIMKFWSISLIILILVIAIIKLSIKRAFYYAVAVGVTYWNNFF